MSADIVTASKRKPMKSTPTFLVLGAAALFAFVCTRNMEQRSELTNGFVELNPLTNVSPDTTPLTTSPATTKKPSAEINVEHATFQEFLQNPSTIDPIAMSPSHWSSIDSGSSPEFGQPIQQIPPMQDNAIPQYTGQPYIESYPTTDEVILQPIQPAMPMQTVRPVQPVMPVQPALTSPRITGIPEASVKNMAREPHASYMPTSNPHFAQEEQQYGSPISTPTSTPSVITSHNFSLQDDDTSEPNAEVNSEPNTQPTTQPTQGSSSKDEPVTGESAAGSNMATAESAPFPVPAGMNPRQPITAFNGVPYQSTPQYPIYNENFENQIYPAHMSPGYAPMGGIPMAGAPIGEVQMGGIPSTGVVTDGAPILNNQHFAGQPCTTQPHVGQSFIGSPPPMFQPAPQRGCKGFFGRQSGNATDIQSDYIPSFSPKAEVGARSQFNTIRPQPFESYDQFAFEEKEQFPKPGELLRSAVYFFDLELGVLQPHFRSNTAIAQSSGGSSFSESFDFDYDTSPRVRVGFESEYGPGFELDYFQFDQNSDLSTFTSDGRSVGSIGFNQLNNQFTSIQATGAGEALNAQHSFELHSYALSAFKALKFKRARIAGRFGLQYVQLHHELDARVFDPAGTETDRLVGTSEFEGFGPRFGLDYFRPVGHTPLELVTTATAAVLFGNQDQDVSNTSSGVSSSIGADEFVTIIDIFAGLQTRKMRGEKRSTFARFGYVNQSWFGAGTATDPSGDLGLQGISFAIGVNR